VPGPPPSPQRRRRNLPTAITRWLPANGRSGPPPDWPLSGPTEAEQDAWTEVWALPQAVAWEHLLWPRTIARYVRCAVASEGLSSAALLAEVRLLEHALGLSPMSLLRLRWEIEPAEGATVTPIAEASRRRLNLAEDEEGEES
jgi:hypothetical protein